MWQEGHTVHTTQEEAEKEVMKILDIYKNTVEEELAIPVTTGKKVRKKSLLVQYTQLQWNQLCQMEKHFKWEHHIF